MWKRRQSVEVRYDGRVKHKYNMNPRKKKKEDDEDIPKVKKTKNSVYYVKEKGMREEM